MNHSQLTPELLAALLTWQSEGRRNVTIEFDRQRNDTGSCMISAYDYTYGAGVLVSRQDDIPSEETLIRQQQLDLEEKRQWLANQLKTLEV